MNTTDQEIEITKETYRKIFKDYASRNSFLNPNVQKMADFFASLLKGKELLDVGCANGRESHYFAQKGFSVTGCDITREFIELAKKNCPECKFLVCDMRHIDLEKNSFDGLWVSASFLHIPKTEALLTLQGFNKVLRPKGILYVSVMEGDFNGLRENTQNNWSERHFSDYGENELKSLIEKSNFKVLEIRSVQTNWGPKFLHFFCRKKLSF